MVRRIHLTTRTAADTFPGVTAPKKLADLGLLTTRQVAKKHKVHRSTVWNWIKSGILRSQRVGQFRAVSAADLAKFRTMYNPTPKG